MRIKIQFILTMILFGFVLVIISTSMIVTNLQEKQIYEKEDIVFNIIKGASELSYLANDYLIYHESQQLERWQSRFTSFTDDISRLQLSNTKQQALVLNLKADAQRLKVVFESSAAAYSLIPERTIDSDSLKLVLSRIAVQGQGLISEASQLSQLLINQLNSFKQINIIISFILIAILVTFFIVSFMTIQRRFFGSIANLQNGTKIIGSGNLDFKFEDIKNDEIGDLSHAFNNMTKSLKDLTSSKADLEREIVKRMQIDEALRESENKYRTLFNNMSEGFGIHEIIFDSKGIPCDYRFLELNMAFEKQTGISREKIFGKTVKQVLPNIDSHWIEYYGKVVLTGKPNHFENYSTPLKRWYESSCYPAGGKNQFAVFFRDITERKKEEKNRIERITKNILKKERDKIAGDLHDSVTQIIFSSSLLAESVLKTWEKDQGKALKNLRMIIDLNSLAFSELRILLYELMPERMSQESLENLITRLVDAANRHSKLKISTKIEGDYNFNYRIKHQVYRIAQETINNILKHSKATEANLYLRLHPNDLKLVISDNGKGFDINDKNIKKRFGLKLMGDRVKATRASLDITSIPGAGTKITLIYPRNK